MLVLRYPVSWGIAKKLKEGDEVRYYGKIVFVSSKALQRMENYYKAEGSFPYDLMGEIVLVRESSPMFLEGLLKMGVSGIVKEGGLELSREALSLSKRFSRPFFETEKVEGSESIKLYADLGEDSLREIWVDSLKMRVIADSRSDAD